MQCMDSRDLILISRGAGDAFGGSEKSRSLISAYRSLVITTDTPGFKYRTYAIITPRFVYSLPTF